MLERVVRQRHGTLPVVAAVAVAVYGALATTLSPFTRPMQAVTILPCLVLLGTAVARGWHRWHLPAEASIAGPGSGAGGRWFSVALAVWFVLIALTVSVQLANFFSSPRDLYPTLSSLASRAFSSHPVRATAFSLWLWLGWYLLDR